MLKELIAQVFCRQIARKLRRFGIVGAVAGMCFALYVELPLEMSIAARETQVMMVDVRHSVEESIAWWERREHKAHFGREVQSTYNRKD